MLRSEIHNPVYAGYGFFYCGESQYGFQAQTDFQKIYIYLVRHQQIHLRGKAPEGGIEAEVNMCLTRISHILESAGIDKTHVVMCRIYLKDMSFWKEVNRVYGEFFGDHTPPVQYMV